MLSLWIVILICIFPLFFVSRFTKKVRDRYPDMFGYLFTLVGTFIAVFVGLYLENIQENNSRKDLAIKVLQSGKKEIQWLMERADRLTKASDTLNTREMTQLHEIETPPFFTQTLRTELMAEMLEPYTIAEFNRIKERMFFDIELSMHENNREQKKDFKNDMENYKKQLSVTISVIDEEVERLRGNISTKKYEENASKRLDSFTTAD